MLIEEKEILKNTEIYQADLIPEESLQELIRQYKNRWPLREVPESLGALLEVLE